MPSHAESCLEAGLAALKQGNYYTAIANLEPLAKEQSEKKICLQAQVGLVMSYARTGEVSKAIALCQNLIANSNPRVQEWAILALEHLHKRKNQQKKAGKTNTQLITSSNPAQQQPQTAYVGTDGDTNIKSVSIYWRNARRAKVWQPLHKPNIIPSRLLAIFTFIALFWMCRELLKSVLVSINQILYQLPYLEPIQILYHDPSNLLLGLFIILMVFSPWLLDWVLTRFSGQEELTKEKLNSYSRETLRVLQRACQQQHWPTPQLRILPISAPMIISYGNLPRTARITVSQGLLQQLADDEIAAIYALSLGQLGRWDFGVMSLVLLVTMPFYGIYQQVSVWGNQHQGKIWRWPGTILAAINYVIWCLLTGTALLNNQLRLYQSDRLSAEITGNPNGLIRALLKTSIGVAHDVGLKEQTCWQLESLNLLAPVAYQHSIVLGSAAGHLPFESFFKWENFQPYRQWFSINSCHPAMGDRIERLCQIARHWHLDTELYQMNPPQPILIKPQAFCLQIAPWLGIPLGVVFASLIWLLWQTAYSLHLLNLKWIYDNWSFVTGCMLIGFSIGTVMRINALFPDITPVNVQKNENFTKLLADPTILPIDSIKVRFTGKLLGRPGIGNCLAQDLILQTSQGLMKLHHIPWLGKSFNPQDLIGRQITVTGWLRRGASPWVDIQTLETQSGKRINSPHPVWSTVIAVVAQAWGAYIMLTGQ
ncbi:zinc metalloprotease HtpX [Dolichospermum sp. ST_sed1]|nr:zinc metalloprotease HtpX [Dolichospermum sp. ST_sed1]MDD1426844.1 zinc metalloprotease HtpX [Dolichospermum sp. ST_sed9]MDD1433471.1 zinc metalloprotease HtpX [Dolichospermum sp. ST_sed6]MDD1443448.1 zinc metalloprotease HtpX [Dolichospermum sp. ST_sed3]MDD1448803.1 zinc metalloprotease HtpX [Dolichospermum sp. ST_sed8]MDD1457385.1 zinc metalloprotease HtpX [Dolichospermum sp. ST_sed7]MDD1461831.1 zinc metalloprotease HtpX [Dolichospermum sp. ST_sed2]MDD1465689.1 zinc metalloprotease Htp